MSLTDPVADLLARIRNAIHARHQKLDIPASKLKLEIARILKEEGYIANFKATEEEGRLRPPSLFLMLAEARSIFELNSSLLLSPLLMRGTPIDREGRLRAGFSEAFVEELTR